MRPYGRAMDFEEYRAHDATSLAKLVADGEVSAAELLTLARERAAAVNPRINAVVRDVPAVPADRPQGPFSGVPFLIKDLAQDYAGLPTSAGSRALMSAPAGAEAVRMSVDEARDGAELRGRVLVDGLGLRLGLSGDHSPAEAAHGLALASCRL